MKKYSKQREEIKKTVMANRIHPTADEVYTIVRKENPQISLGTVYRNLNALSESGVIQKISVGDGYDRFDGDVSQHYHVLCTECGKIFDARIEIAQDLNWEILAQTGVEVSSQNFVFKGICNDCRTKN